MTEPRKQPNVKTINFDPAVLAALDRKAEQTGRSRSQLVNYAVAQLVGVRVDFNAKIEEEKE